MHIPDLYADVDLQMLKKRVQALEDKLTESEREWVGLTDDERDAITKNIIGFNSCSGWEDEYAMAIEAKLKEKNGAL